MHITTTEDINIHIVVFDITSITKNIVQISIISDIKNLKQMLKQKH